MAENNQNVRKAARIVATLGLVAIAAVIAWFAWQHYVYAPWTRDARVQADVVNIAPEVSGTVIRVAVFNNSYVHKGELLFRIDPARFKHALAEARARLKQAKAQARYDQRNAQRLEALPPGGVSTQKLQQAQTKAQGAVATIHRDQARLAQAKQNLAWASVNAPVDGYVTHLLLNQGDYASRGQSVVTMVDARTFRVIAYFEETKIPRIELGDAVSIHLMAGGHTLSGHVASFAHGIAVANYAKGERNLPDVNPTFQWVRLAQREPVTITFDRCPTDVPLSIGLTATVRVKTDDDSRQDKSQPVKTSPCSAKIEQRTRSQSGMTPPGAPPQSGHD